MVVTISCGFLSPKIHVVLWGFCDEVSPQKKGAALAYRPKFQGRTS